MIEVSNLSFAFEDGRQIIDDLSFTVADGERLCIRASSGEGKTTLLRMIAGLNHAQSGKIMITGGQKVGMVFQSHALFPWQTALENVKNTCCEETARHWLEAFGLGDSLNKYPSELSGGMCRRVALARAVGYEPDILLMDEPFTGLDSEIKTRVMNLIAEHFSSRVILFTTHDESEHKQFATRTVSLCSQSSDSGSK